jgi:maltose alpha-D-glucosyltransferase / alpha-amylase
VLALLYTWQGSRLLAVHNLSQRPCTVRLDPRESAEEPVCTLHSILSAEHSQPCEDGRHLLTLEGYAYRWFRVGEQDDAKQGAPKRGR